MSEQLWQEQPDGSRKYGEFYWSGSSDLPVADLLLWGMGSLLLLASCWYAGTYYLRRRRQQRFYRKQAFIQLKQIYQRYQQKQHDSSNPLAHFLQQIQQLLKQTAATACRSGKRREDGGNAFSPIAALSGDAWYRALLRQIPPNLQRKHGDLLRQDIVVGFTLCYQPASAINAQLRLQQQQIAANMYQFAVLWIRHHRI